MKKFQHILTILLLTVAIATVKAQDASLVKSASTLEIIGTSTIHDWEITCEEIKGSGMMAIAENKIANIENIKVTVPVKGLKSGKGLMDSKTYDALKEKDNPNIIYQLIEIQKITDKGSNTYNLAAKGKLTIAGVTKDITHNVDAVILENKVLFSGEYSLDMKAYSVEPPTAMMGTIKTGNKVTVKFNVTYQLNHKN